MTRGINTCLPPEVQLEPLTTSSAPWSRIINVIIVFIIRVIFENSHHWNHPQSERQSDCHGPPSQDFCIQWKTHFRHSAPAPSSCARPLFFFLKSTKIVRMMTGMMLMTGMMTIMVKICTLTCHIVCCLWHHFSIAESVSGQLCCARFPRLRPFILETMGWCNMYLAGIVQPYGELFGFDSLAFHFRQLYHQWWPTQNV